LVNKDLKGGFMAQRLLYRLRFAFDPAFRIKVAIVILEKRTFRQYPDPEWVEATLWALTLLSQHKAKIRSQVLAVKLEKYLNQGGHRVLRQQIVYEIEAGSLEAFIASFRG
jgi:hypothetical protein